MSGSTIALLGIKRNESGLSSGTMRSRSLSNNANMQHSHQLHCSLDTTDHTRLVCILSLLAFYPHIPQQPSLHPSQASLDRVMPCPTFADLELQTCACPDDLRQATRADCGWCFSYAMANATKIQEHTRNMIKKLTLVKTANLALIANAEQSEKKSRLIIGEVKHYKANVAHAEVRIERVKDECNNEIARWWCRF